MIQNSKVIGGIIADTSDRVLSGNIADISDRVLSGNISPGSIITRNAEWGSIDGDITNQTDLIKELNKKEKTESTKIIEFFETKPEYQNRYLISIDEQPIASVKDYLQLIIDDRVGNNSLWIPFDIGTLCLIIDASGTELDRAVRFFIPKTGMTGVVDLTHESDLVKFIYRYIDEVSPTEWADIQGSVFDNPELATVLNAKLNKWDNITIADVDSLFE